MALATLSVSAGYLVDNTQKEDHHQRSNQGRFRWLDLSRGWHPS